jgi:hypothetical protein
MTAVMISTSPIPAVALQWFWFAGMVALAAGVALERYARVSGREKAKRAIPGVVVAVLLILLAVGQQNGALRLQPAYEPYCDGWWYYSNALCWFAN